MTRVIAFMNSGATDEGVCKGCGRRLFRREDNGAATPIRDYLTMRFGVVPGFGICRKAFCVCGVFAGIDIAYRKAVRISRRNDRRERRNNGD